MNDEKIKNFIKTAKDNLKVIIGIAILTIIIFYIISIYYNTVKYSINTLDDFIHYCSYKSIFTDRKFDLFDFAWKYAIWHCVDHGGLYFSMFIQILLGPNPYTDIIAKNELVMVLNMGLYFTSLFIFIFTIISRFIIRNVKTINKLFLSLIVFLAMLVLHNSYQFYYEIFTWFSGAASYSIPISFLFISIALFINFIEMQQKKKYILVLPIIFTSIAALGGSISVLCIAFTFMLALLIYVLSNKKLDLVSIAIFFHYLCFALLNVKAPGNYHRLARTIDKSISYTNELFDPERIILVINTANEIITERYIYLFSKYNFVIILILVSLWIGYLVAKQIHTISYQKTILTILPIILMPYLVSLSFAVGYQDKTLMLDRCFFPIDLSIIFTMLVLLSFVFFIVLYVVDITKKELICSIAVIMIILIHIFMLGNSSEESIKNRDISRIELINVAIDGSLGKYKEYHDKCAETIKKLKSQAGTEEVHVKYIPYDEAPKYMMKFYDGQHMPWILPNEDYLPCFYDIKEIIVTDDAENNN